MRLHRLPAEGVPNRAIPGTSTSSDTTAAQIRRWVESHYSASTIGGTTVYDLSSSS